jgi:hypothetical protein
MRNRYGRLWTVIGQAVNRAPTEVRDRYEILTYRAMHGRDRPVPSSIKCMTCGQPFETSDRRRIRRCDVCKGREAREGGLPDNMEASTSFHDYDEHPSGIGTPVSRQFGELPDATDEDQYLLPGDRDFAE